MAPSTIGMSVDRGGKYPGTNTTSYGYKKCTVINGKLLVRAFRMARSPAGARGSGNRPDAVCRSWQTRRAVPARSPISARSEPRPPDSFGQSSFGAPAAPHRVALGAGAAPAARNLVGRTLAASRARWAPPPCPLLPRRPPARAACSPPG